MESQAVLRAAMSAPMLGKEDELELARRWREQRDVDALRALTRSYLRLVISMASRFRSYGLPVSDLIQEGTVGLMEAAGRFEPEREIRFSTYASWWIRSSMQDYILRNWSIVRTGTTAAHKSLFFNLRRLRAQIVGDYDGPMTYASRQLLAEKLGVRLKDVEVMEARLTGYDRSLNAMVGEDGESEWMDFLASDAPQPDEELEEINDSRVKMDLLRDAMKILSEREMTIIRERRLGDDSVTLAALGERLGISKERVRQIETQALNKLRTALINRVGDPVSAGLVSSYG
ncbi:RNA polymerase factor sigma-32 [Pedomonas mirosovicensis]|uniref:RNA polymerase factor sigma-32 n=1 Tax=Pedomonas mirosovicensis TaxID=2908641 RepID=UPI002167A993|nr:RNA polymerase factor sigma-32 [Pedomonas mirosovicensis]MCH8683857.1 RNA polymerase factor sigma-32 [Pedomonas mirosovicensis]